MAKSPVDILLRHLRTLTSGQPVPEEADQHLLERFIRQRDEAAFATLLERHGPMVLGVCRRTLHDEHLAEDVLQATFLVLARNAGAIRKRKSLGSWLHGVALRLARKAQADAARAGRGDVRPAPEPPPGPAAEASWREVRQILDDELARLPESYRLPLVLCYLEGRTRDEAATELGWTTTRLKGYLERGRDRLRSRLIRRGLVPGAVAGATLLAESTLAAPLPPLLAIATLRAALCLTAGEIGACGVSETVIRLAAGGVGIMGPKKALLCGALVLSLFGALAAGTRYPGQGPMPPAASGSTDGQERPKGSVHTKAHGTPITLNPVKPDRDRSRDRNDTSWREKATFRNVMPRPEDGWKPGSLFPGFVRLSPDGKRLAVGKNANLLTFALLDLATGKDQTDQSIALDDRREYQFLGFTPDGKAWAVREVTAGPALVGWALVDWVSGQERSRVTERGRWRMALSSDGKVLAGIDARGKVMLWEAATGMLLRTLATPPTDHYGFLAFAPDSKTLATAGFPPRRYAPATPPDRRANLTLWDVATGKKRSGSTLQDDKADLGWPSLFPAPEAARAMQFTPDGRRLAIACSVVLPGQPYAQTVLRLWEVAGLKAAGQLASEEYGSLRDYAFSPDGNTIAMAWMGKIAARGPGKPTVYAPAPVTIVSLEGKEIARIPPSRSGYAAVAFSRDGTLLATQDNQGIVKVWERTSAK